MRTLIVLGTAIVLSSTIYVTRGVAGPVSSGSPVTAQESHDHEHAAVARPNAQDAQRGMRGQMMAKKNAVDEDALNHLVATMNAATGDAKIVAITDLLTRLVQQQTTAKESMKAMKSQCSMAKDPADGEAKPEP